MNTTVGIVTHRTTIRLCIIMGVEANATTLGLSESLGFETTA